MARVLILFAHPALQKSRVNRVLAETARQISGVTFHDLYEVYPDLYLNVDREQELLKQHDVIIFQHPFYWYSTPAILKEWQDLVLEWGFAYGEGGTALQGKRLMSAITAGGPEDAYRREGFNYFSVRELLAPMEQTARLCGMEYLPPFVQHAALSFNPAMAEDAARTYGTLLSALRDEQIDYPQLRTRRYTNDGPLPLVPGKGA